MITYDETLEMLNDIASEFPTEFYADLNGGVVLADETKHHEDGLYTLGQYVSDPYGLGRYINIYYGSFRRLYGHADKREQRRQLWKILSHEFTHHIESLAGDESLEKKDREALLKYKAGKYDSDADNEPRNRQKAVRNRRKARRNE